MFFLVTGYHVECGLGNVSCSASQIVEYASEAGCRLLRALYTLS